MVNLYVLKGYRDREHYLRSLAVEYDVSLESVKMIASVLGPTEDFDGLPVMLEDYGDVLNGEA